MENVTIILSAGHGGINPHTNEYECLAGGKSFKYSDGKEYHGDGWIYEGVLNRGYCATIAHHAMNRGYNVGFAHHEYMDYPLEKRVELGNSHDGKCVYIPVHFNASRNHNGRGFEIYTTRGQNNSDELAEIIWGKMITLKRAFPSLKLRPDQSDGDNDKEANFLEIRKIKHLAVYLEVLFFDNKDDLQLILNKDFQDIFCKYIVDAIDLYYRSN